MNKNADSDKYFCSGYVIESDTPSPFSLWNNKRFSKSVIAFGVDNSLSEHGNNRKKDISTFAMAPASGLDGTIVQTIKLKKKVCVRMQPTAFFANWEENLSIQGKRLWKKKIFPVFW